MSKLSELNIEFLAIDEQYQMLNKKRNLLLTEIKKEEKTEKNKKDKQLKLQHAIGSGGWEELDARFCEIIEDVSKGGKMWVANIIINTNKLLSNSDIKTELILAIGSRIINDMYENTEKRRKTRMNTTKRFYRQFGRRDILQILKPVIIKAI